jgi:hypothetical protein
MSKVKHPYSGRITAILHEGGLVITKLDFVSDKNTFAENFRYLDEVEQHAQRVRDEIKQLDKRGNAILSLVMKECGIKEPWALSFDQKFSDIRKHTANGRIRFTLLVPKNSKWKSSFSQCPVLKVLPMEMPIEWLDMKPAQLRKAIAR